MVPLPDAAELLAVEAFATYIRSMRAVHRLIKTIVAMGCAWIEPCARRTAVVSLESYHWPTIHPCHGHKANRAANGMEVLHKECPPRAVLILHDATLMGIGAGRGILVERTK